jgi:nicotinamidase-related amidase
LVCLDLVRAELRADGEGDADLDRRIEASRRLLLHARWRGWEITHVHPRSASHAARPVAGLEPSPDERLIYRTGVSAFTHRVFCDAVKAAPEAELVLVALSLSSACLATAVTAHDWGLPVILASDVVLGQPGPDAASTERYRDLRAAIAPFGRIAVSESLIDVRRGLRLVESAVQAA